MSKKNKFLYDFVVEKEVEKQVSEKKMEGDQEVTVTRTEKSKEPVKFCILRPTRRLYDSAEIFMAKMVSDYIKEGLMPITLVAKRFGNDGGALTKEQADYVAELQTRLDSQHQKLVNLKLGDGEKDVAPSEAEVKPEDKPATMEDRSKILVEMMNIQAEIDRLRDSYLSLYENTAEMKARKKTIEWWITQLSYHGGDVPVEFFTEDSFEKRYQKYVEIFDGDDEFLRRTLNKFTFLVGTWFANANSSMAMEDFKDADQHFEANFQDD